MKINLKYIYLLGLLFLIGYSCKKMDDSYREYIVPGGLTYPGKAVSPMAYSGHNRVKISWLRGTDPTVVRAIVFWENYTDSVTVDIPNTGDTISTIIGNLQEQQYTFEIVTCNANGDRSVPSEVIGTSYGDDYQTSLLNRPITQAVNYGKDTAFVKWGAANITEGAYATEISYTDISNQNRIKRFAISDTASFLSAINATDIQYRTIYLPDSTAIDTFYTAFDTYRVATKMNTANWTITADSYEPTGQLPNGPPEKVLDGDASTYWHTDHTTTKPGFPHWLAVDLKSPAVLAMVELTSRSNSLTADATDFIVQGSMDGNTWTDYGTFKQPDIAGPQASYISNPPTVRYVRIYMTKGPNYYTHLAELSLYRY